MLPSAFGYRGLGSPNMPPSQPPIHRFGWRRGSSAPYVSSALPLCYVSLSGECLLIRNLLPLGHAIPW